jgi:hypothetical protein
MARPTRGRRAKAPPTGAPRPRGRPSTYSKKLAQQIADRLADGTPLTVVCRAADMPDARTIRRWQHKHSELCPLILRAREWAADALADQILLIAENLTGNVARDRVRIAARMWLASKLGPKRYGDRITADVTLLTTEQMLASHLARFGGKPK